MKNDFYLFLTFFRQIVEAMIFGFNSYYLHFLILINIMFSLFIATASTSFDFERSNHDPMATHEPMSDKSPVLRGSPFETLVGHERGAPAPRSEDRTNKVFYKFVKRHTKESKIKFQRSPALISATKFCLKMWFNTDALTKKQMVYCENFAKQVPYWYKSARNDVRLFHAHSCKYLYELVLNTGIPRLLAQHTFWEKKTFNFDRRPVM